MRHSIPVKIASITWLIFGLPLLLAPDWLMTVYRAPALSGTGEYNSMLLGAAYVALAAMSWMTSNVSAGQARIFVLGGLLANTLSFLVAIYRQLFTTTAVQAGWVNVAVTFVFALVFLWLVTVVRGDDTGRVAR